MENLKDFMENNAAMTDIITNMFFTEYICDDNF